MSRAASLPIALVATATSFFFSSCADTTTTIGRFSPRVEPGAGAGGGDGAGGSAGLGGSASDLRLYFEAEDGAITGPFVTGSAGQPPVIHITASEGNPSESAPGNARALYQFNIERAGDYLIWGRIQSPGALENRFWFRVNDGAWTLWRISTGEEWFWDDFHDDTSFGEPVVFYFEEGPQKLELSNSVMGSKLDAISIAPFAAAPPSQDITCNPPHSVLLEGSCVRSCGSYLNVSCTPSVCEGREEVIAYDCAVCCLLDDP